MLSKMRDIKGVWHIEGDYLKMGGSNLVLNMFTKHPFINGMQRYRQK